MNRFNGIKSLILSKITRDSAAEMGWVISGQLTSVILSFVIVKILSGMGAEDYGIYVLILTAAAFLGIIYGPLQQAFIRFYYDYLTKNLIDQYVKCVFNYLKNISFFFLLLVIIFYVLSPYLVEFSESSSFFILAGIYIIVLKVSEFFNSGLNVLRRRKENSILQGTEKIIIILFLLLFVYGKRLTLTNAFIALDAGVIIFLFIKIKIFKRYSYAKSNSQLDPGRKTEISRSLIKYSGPFLIWALAGWLQLNGEKWIINGVLTTSDVGIYAIMMTIVNAFVAIPNNIISEFVTPIIFKQYADLNNKESVNTGFHYIRITIGFVLLLTVFSTIITYFLGEQLIVIISNKTYTLYWYLLPLLCLGTGLFFTGQAQALLGLALNEPQKYIAPKIASGVLSVILNLFLIKSFGIKGVSFTILLVGVFYIVYISMVNNKLLKIMAGK